MQLPLCIAHNNGTSGTLTVAQLMGSAAPQGSITWTGVNTFSPLLLAAQVQQPIHCRLL
ncbi:MAG: hypothetical protein IPJ29_05900 [Chitinophagaceae bacterium]|nr:hypothetical protein [Chitinophagaceae bacterium]